MTLIVDTDYREGISIYYPSGEVITSCSNLFEEDGLLYLDLIADERLKGARVTELAEGEKVGDPFQSEDVWTQRWVVKNYVVEGPPLEEGENTRMGWAAHSMRMLARGTSAEEDWG
jgi:hypothetical protein